MKQILPRIVALACVLLACVGRTFAAQVVFSEVMYQPVGNKPEFLEIWNITATPLDTARWTFTNGLTYTFPDFNTGSPQAHFLRANERIILSSADETTTRAAYPTIPANVRVLGPWTAGSLSNSGEQLTLVDINGVVMANLEYADSGKWPVSPDGTGHSLVLTDENQETDNWRVWRASTNNGGSPGIADPAPPAAGLALNEVHFNGAGQVDWIELRNNSSTTTQPATGLFLASTLNFNNKVALSGDLTPGAVASFTVSFPSDSGSVRLFLIDSANNVRDSVLITRRPGRDSWQVFPAGSREWYNDAVATQNAQNNPSRNTDIVINEIMADPPSNQRDGEFVELYNKGTLPVDVGGWTLDDDVNFTIPPGTTIPAGGYLVIGANAAWLNSQYTGLTAIGDWSGSLGNNGDRLRLEDANGNLADEVDFRFGGEWPGLAGGDGSSLELSNPNADNSLGGAWRDSDESNKSTFQSFTINGGSFRDEIHGGQQDREVRIWTTGDSHIVLKNLVLRPTTGGNNLFVNGGVTTLNNDNVSGWQSRGTHADTFHDAEGIHLVADGGGDNKVNHMEKDAAGMAINTQYTMTFEARWVYGSPRLITQTWDLSWGGTVFVPIPNNLGTPGAVNSRFVADPPPQVTALSHSPVRPIPGQTITVTARISSASPVSNVQLWHRLDNINASNPWSSLPMADNGLSGDAVAGDGIYTGQIQLAAFSGYNAAGSIVQYYVRATADNGQIAELPKRGANAPGMWVVDTNAQPTDFRRVRIIISAYWGDALNQGSGTGGQTVKYNYKYPLHANRYFPCVVTINDSTIYYDSGVHKTGSPFTRGTGNTLDRGRLVLPGDKKFRGKSRIYWDNDGVGGNLFHNRIHRYLLYLLGVPANENEVCRIAKNNASYTIRETNEVFDGDMLNRIWDNGNNGTFYEMDDRFWIADDGATRLDNNDGSWDYKAGDSQGAENPTAYHNQFTPQSREAEYDYNAFISWCQQVENSATPVDRLERMADTRAITAYAAVRGYSADWDNMTMQRGKNGYFFNRPTDHKWMFMHWDSDLSFRQEDIEDPPIGTLTNIPNYFNKPLIRRYLHFYINQMITTYATNGPRIGAWLAAEEASSPSFSVPSTYANWPTLRSGSNLTRHDFLRNWIGTTTANASFLTNFPSPGSNVTGNTVDVTGTAQITALKVICVGHPEAIFSWTTNNVANTSPWKLAGIQLREGTNLFTFRQLGLNDVPVGNDITLTLTKSGDAPPVVNLTVDPNSQNAELGQPVALDASASYDPELAGPLTYAWTVTPNTGFNVLQPSDAQRILTFTKAGSYTVTVQATDIAGSSSTSTRVISVYSGSGFDSFNGNVLTGYTVENVKLRDNNPSQAWYSLNETDNNLVIQVVSPITMPLRPGAPGFPLVTRPMPELADCVLQTDLALETRQFGAFQTGLYLETMESGILTRYVFCLEAGTDYRVYRSTGAVNYVQVGTLAYNGESVALRILRSGNTLHFQRKVNGGWEGIQQSPQPLPANSTLVRGGLFVATGGVNTTPSSISSPGLRVAFDYLLLADPGSTTELVGNLRITEIMYNPLGAGGVEYVELRNFSAAPLNLNGAFFEDGAPFSAQFTFGNLTLQPGQYCVVTNDTSGFMSLYGNQIIIAGQYAGSLNNDGERIVLRDAGGNLIHDFSFSDVAPWPLTPDGQGPSLEASVNDPALYGLGTSWRASYEIGGTPGFKGLAVDSDQDGFSDGVELAYGSDPNNAGSSPSLPTTSRNPVSGHVTLSWASQNGRNYVVQYRDSLTEGNWEPLGDVTATGPTATFVDTTSGGKVQRFYRVATQFP